MDLMAYLFGGGNLRAATPGPTNDFWYNPVGMITESGIRIDEEQAKKLSAWYRGRDILATVLAMLPLQVHERLPDDGGSEPAKRHPVYDILHDTPNGWQDSFQWRRQQMYNLIDHGNGVNRIVPGRRGFLDELWPINPRLVSARQLNTKRIVYDVRDPKTNLITTYTQDEIFHLRGASDDGIWGKGILEYARTSLGTASATESYAGTIFSRGTLNGGVIENPGTLDEDAGKRMAQSFITASKDWHMPKILEQGSKWVPNKMTPEDAQMLLSRKHTVDDIARWLGVPRLMLENSDPSYGNAEQFTQNFLDFNMGGWLAMWEYAANHQLILDPRKYFVRFNRKAIGRMNFKDMVDGHVALVNAGIESVDEARSVEDMPKRGGKAAELREPQNITGKAKVNAPVEDDEPEPAARRGDAKATAIAVESAARVLRKEVTAVQKMAVRHAANGDAFAVAVTAFYADHATLVAQTLLMSEVEARQYCAGQASAALAGWLSAVETWKSPEYAAGLAAIALEEVA